MKTEAEGSRRRRRRRVGGFCETREHRTLHPYPANCWEKVWPAAVITYFSLTDVPTCERCFDRVRGGALLLNLDQTDINRFIFNAQSFFSSLETYFLLLLRSNIIFLLTHVTVSSGFLIDVKQGTNIAMVRGLSPCLNWLSTCMHNLRTLTHQKELSQM